MVENIARLMTRPVRPGSARSCSQETLITPRKLAVPPIAVASAPARPGSDETTPKSRIHLAF